MKAKEGLKTVRFSKEEQGYIDLYLKQNPAIGNFSSLARIALLDFIAKRGTISLQPIVREKEDVRLSFLWDYDLSEGQVREILAGPLKQRRWLVARILEHAKLKEVFIFLTLKQIEQDIPYLRLPEKIKKHWEYALKRWRRT